MRRLIWAILLALCGIGQGIVGPAAIQVHAAVQPCASEPIAVWFNHDPSSFHLIQPCVHVRGIATRIAIQGSTVLFSLFPDPDSLHFENGANTAFGAAIVVELHGRTRIHGALLNGAHVRVTGPLVQDNQLNLNTVASALRVDVLPPGPVPRSLHIRIGVAPPVMKVGTEASVIVYAPAGAVCTATVRYNTGRIATSFNRGIRTVSSNGLRVWSWHALTAATWGTATAYCIRGGVQHTMASATFTIFH
jgi:hypothetical protein